MFRPAAPKQSQTGPQLELPLASGEVMPGWVRWLLVAFIAGHTAFVTFQVGRGRWEMAMQLVQTPVWMAIALMGSRVLVLTDDALVVSGGGLTGLLTIPRSAVQSVDRQGNGVVMHWQGSFRRRDSFLPPPEMTARLVQWGGTERDGPAATPAPVHLARPAWTLSGIAALVLAAAGVLAGFVLGIMERQAGVLLFVGGGWTLVLVWTIQRRLIYVVAQQTLLVWQRFGRELARVPLHQVREVEVRGGQVCLRWDDQQITLRPTAGFRRQLAAAVPAWPK